MVRLADQNGKAQSSQYLQGVELKFGQQGREDWRQQMEGELTGHKMDRSWGHLQGVRIAV